MKVKMTAVRRAFENGLSRLEKSKVPEARASAEFLLAHALQIGRGEILGVLDKEISPKQKSSFESLIRKRAGRLPLAYATGSQPFLNLEILCAPGALIPRPETEEMVFEIFQVFAGREKETLYFLDVGSGTGAIALSLADHFKRARVFAMEKSARAHRIFKKNIAAHQDLGARIDLVERDFLKPWPFPENFFDLIISNPPYIPTGEIAGLSPEVLKEPRLALDGGADGLKHLRAVIARAPRYLKPGGFLAAEMGSQHGSLVAALVKDAGFGETLIMRDASGLERFVLAQKWSAAKERARA